MCEERRNIKKYFELIIRTVRFAIKLYRVRRGLLCNFINQKIIENEPK